MAIKIMKIGTLLTTAIVSLSAIGGGLAVYVAVTKYETMDKVSVAQNRLAVVRAVGDIPRYLNSERGFATNILFGPATVDPKLRAELNALSLDELNAQLLAVDPLGAEKIDRQNKRRLVRALEIFVQTNRPAAAQRVRAPGRAPRRSRAHRPAQTR